MPEAEWKAPAQQLWDAGITDFIPIAPPEAELSPTTGLDRSARGKTPGQRRSDGLWRGFPQWTQHQTTREDIAEWADWDANLGLRTRNYPAIDVDIDDPDVARDFQEAITQVLGGAPLRRIGRAPRFAILCRTDAPFRKVTCPLFLGDGTRAGTIEILGDGGQLVVAGTHPKTGKPYAWTDGVVTGGLELLASRSPESLPLLTADVISQQLMPALERVAQRHGLALRCGRASQVTSPTRVDQAELRAPSIEILREAVAAVPNAGDQFGDRRDYLTMLCAIKAAAGPEQEAEGLNIALEWAGRWSDGYNDPAVVERDWHSLNPPFRVGFDLIASWGRECGFNSAALDFDCVGPARAPSVEEAVLLAPPPDGVVERAHRIASLHGDPTRALYLVLADVPDPDLRALLTTLERAAKTRDPLHEVFRRLVLPRAKRLQAFVRDPTQFRILLEVELQEEAGWDKLGPQYRELLTEAAFTLLAPVMSVLGAANTRAGEPVPIGNVARDDLVEGLIPAKGVAALVGPPASGKSFLAIELAARVAKTPASDELTGEPQPECFGGRRVQHGSVLYFASEDADGVAARLARWNEAYGAIPNLHVFARVPRLSVTEDAIAMVLGACDTVLNEGAPPLRLIVVDVFRAAFDGEENSSDAVAAATVTASILARLTGATVLLVHHAGLGDPKRARGSSAFTAAMDVIGSVKMIDGEISMTIEKNKNGPAGGLFRWQLNKNGVIEPANLRNIGEAELMSTQCARAAGFAICQIASPAEPVSRAALRHEMVAGYPALFSPERIPRSTAESHVSRGIHVACENGWIQAVGKNRYVPGPKASEVSALEPGDLEKILA